MFKFEHRKLIINNTYISLYDTEHKKKQLVIVAFIQMENLYYITDQYVLTAALFLPYPH